jgi:UDP-N-acetylmuramyl pentapeptide phosphotransferase/UDP-N-acetylglucosamine-1-phosphate transferase
MEAVAYTAAPISGLFLSWLVTLLLTRTRAGPLDEPNSRSLHRRPIPRTGGLAIVLAVVAGWLAPGPQVAVPVMLAVLALAALSFVDDVRSLPAALRLAAHLATAALLVALLDPGLPLLLAIAAVLAIAWMINLYNFMDGSDGLAGGMAVIGFFVYGSAAWLAGDAGFAAANWTVSAAAAGFLVFNFHPARIFMGDSGSVPLGLLAGVLGMSGWSSGYWPLWFPILVFSPFVVDASVTLVRRAWQREAVWQAHRDHYYQRLVRLGWGHRATALAEYAVMIACGAAALYGLRLTGQGQRAVIGLAALAYMFAMLAIDAAWRGRREPAR